MRGKTFQTWLVIITILAVVTVVSVIITDQVLKKEENKIPCLDNPTIGNPSAKVHLILFEDVSCYNCQVFIRSIFPTIKEKYIDTGKAKITFIPLAFLKGSNVPSNAELCVYNISPDHYYSFAQKLHSSEDQDI
ncbi:MAG: thioredoxin domain-containing protein, partial [Chlamydiota bacterium]